MQKIAVITAGVFPVPPVEGGAVENLLYTFIKSNEITNDYKLTVYSLNSSKLSIQKEQFKNVQFVFVNRDEIVYKIGRGIRFLLNKLRPTMVGNQFIYEVLRKQKNFNSFDSVLIENQPSFAKFIRKITNKPIILHLHNDSLYAGIKNAEKVLSNVDLVLAVSNYVKKRVETVSCSTCRVDTVYNGININRFTNTFSESTREKYRNHWGFTPEDKVIIYAGRLQAHKGVKLLIESFLKLNANSNAKLLIVGGSEFGNSKKSKFIKEIQKISIVHKSNIRFTGYVDYSEIHKLFSIADFAVLPSLCEEAFPLTALEALASGLPVILTDSGGMPEAVNDKCGIVVKRGVNAEENLIKAMNNLLENPKLLSNMAVEARKRAETFDEKIYSKNLSMQIKTVL